VRGSEAPRSENIHIFLPKEIEIAIDKSCDLRWVILVNIKVNLSAQYLPYERRDT
jgi:hypothetical protein